jgi:hypothetical protein
MLIVFGTVLTAPIAHAQNREIYIPIIESFKKPEPKSLIINNVAGCTGTAPNIYSCQELFEGIQAACPGKQDAVIKDMRLWEEGMFPECFVVGNSGVNIIENYLGLIYQWMAGLVGGIAVLMIIVGGIQIATGGGDQNNVNEGKTKIMQALAGLAILFLSGLILYTINPTFFTGG